MTSGSPVVARFMSRPWKKNAPGKGPVKTGRVFTLLRVVVLQHKQSRQLCRL